jgi:hypothetical protein
MKQLHQHLHCAALLSAECRLPLLQEKNSFIDAVSQLIGEIILNRKLGPNVPECPALGCE